MRLPEVLHMTEHKLWPLGSYWWVLYLAMLWLLLLALLDMGFTEYKLCKQRKAKRAYEELLRIEAILGGEAPTATTRKMTQLLVQIGLVRRDYDKHGNPIRWPIHVEPWWIWKVHVRCMLRGEWFCGRDKISGKPRRGFPWGSSISAFGVFRNLPGVIKWEKGRLLPRRWGFHILGLEIGDRG